MLIFQEMIGGKVKRLGPEDSEKKQTDTPTAKEKEERDREGKKKDDKKIKPVFGEKLDSYEFAERFVSLSLCLSCVCVCVCACE